MGPRLFAHLGAASLPAGGRASPGSARTLSPAGTRALRGNPGDKGGHCHLEASLGIVCPEPWPSQQLWLCQVGVSSPFGRGLRVPAAAELCLATLNPFVVHAGGQRMGAVPAPQHRHEQVTHWGQTVAPLGALSSGEGQPGGRRGTKGWVAVWQQPGDAQPWRGTPSVQG